MRVTKILLVCFGLALLGLRVNQAPEPVVGNPIATTMIVADGGAPLPPPFLVLDGGAPLPPPVLIADGGVPLPPPSVGFATAA